MPAESEDTTETLPGSPDDRSIKDIGAVEECDVCATAPAAIVCVEREEDGTNWECYNCGAMI